MNLFDYIPDLGEHGSLREEPTMKKPNSHPWSDYTGDPIYSDKVGDDWFIYESYLASLRVIPCTKELKEWIEKNPKEGYERDVDFVIDGNIAGRKFPYYEKAMDDMREAEKDAMKESEDELWEEVVEIIDPFRWAPFSLNELKQHFTIKRKP